MGSDELLRELMQKSTPDHPSDAFVDRVMEQIRQTPELSAVKKPFYMYLRSVLPFILLVGIVALFLLSSDLPLIDNLLGTGTIKQTVLFYFNALVVSMKIIFAWKFFSFAFMVILSGGILMLIDQLFSRRAKDFFLSKGL
ncbi:MAG: hypothetical protein WCO93_01535 [bacterium]